MRHQGPTRSIEIGMISDLDIYRTATQLIKQYGDQALIEAAMRQDKMVAEGNAEGASLWSRIAVHGNCRA